ncbi:hypothetical protein ISS37_11045 [candidate division KSB1 bacterium]|nr:hypothetical protein [candidate division KSB1 bacterium]
MPEDDNPAPIKGTAISAISRVISKKRKSRRIQQAIADKIGLPVEEVFPPRKKVR